MKLKQLLFVGALSLVPLGLTVPAKAQSYGCPATYGQVREAIDNAIVNDNLYSVYEIALYPARSEVLYNQIVRYIYDNPNCSRIRGQVGQSLRSFGAAIEDKKQQHRANLQQLNELRFRQPGER